MQRTFVEDEVSILFLGPNVAEFTCKVIYWW